MDSLTEKTPRSKNPRAEANPLSAVTFSWMLPLFFKSLKKDLTLDDLFEPLDEHKSSKLGGRLEKEWDAEVLRSKKLNKQPSLLRPILKIFGFKLILYGLQLSTSCLGFMIAKPLFLGGLISYFTLGSTKDDAYFSATGFVVCVAFVVLIEHPFILGTMHLGMKLRVAVCSLVYRKALKLSKMSLGKTTVGQVVNLMSNDVNRFDLFFLFIHYLWIGPVSTCVVTYLMWLRVGPASVLGVTSLLILIPFQGWLGKQASNLRLKTAHRTDYRVHIMNEIITGIQVIKMYTWEKPFAKLVSQSRKKEINQITKSSYIRGIMNSFIIFHARTAIFFTIISYVLLGNSINAEDVFVLTSLYSILRESMTIFFPLGITQLAEGLVSVERIRKFLVLELQNEEFSNFVDGNEVEKNHFHLLTKYEHFTHEGKKPGIIVKNACAKWSPDSLDNSLNSLDLEVSYSQLTVIVGTVGSGKSSFFLALLKELSLTSGTIKISGKISYASQESWLFQGSIRQNILFGEPYDKARYQAVTRACSLLIDFEQFPHGDKTIVGERGVSLSGGQRARVNLARAVYKNADIYLLDDPLSAVDTHVGKHLFEECIQGFLRNKTVLVITHQLQYLENVDQIVLLENGRILAKGTYQELQKSSMDFKNVVAHKGEEEFEEKPHLPKNFLSRRSSQQSLISSINDENVIDIEPEEEAEMQSKGSVGWYVYRMYLKSGGGWFFLFLVLSMFIFTQALASGCDIWITYWVNSAEYAYTNGTLTLEESYPYIYVFSALTAATVFVVLIRSFMYFKLCMNSSKKLHGHMFSSITRAPMLFFNNNPSGRILNRFSKDMGTIDELLPSTLLDVFQIAGTLLAILTVVAIINPWLLIPTGICATLFYFMRIFYTTTSRCLKRLEGISRSPVFTHLNASLQGLTTIRAFNAQERLIHEFDAHQDLHSTAWYLFIAASRTFGFWLDLFCVVYITSVTFSFILMDEETMGGNVGLAITQAAGLTGMFQWGMRQSAELENQMTSVERVLEYSNLESEPPLESSPDKKPKKSWPDDGKIEFSNVHLRYGPNSPWVLQKLFFTVVKNEKVGIVGRTGAGKSSLISALFRLAEISGEIKIDGINTADLGLHDLRSKISIIPQEAILFSGSLRKNLDPFDEHEDAVLWSALDKVELRETVEELNNGLQEVITEGGSNLSIGQRQLICLARAIVKNNKILVLDEATANVDPKTDSLIQKTIREKFANCTVLTIAHRLNTVMDSDKVLVMNAGTMVEFDHPHVLLQNKEGYLYKMVEQTGRAMMEALTTIAEKNYLKSKDGDRQ